LAVCTLAWGAGCRQIAGVGDVTIDVGAASGAGGGTSSGSSSATSTATAGGGGTGGAPSCDDTQVDPKNCGVCGHDCQGGLCQFGFCRPVTLSDAPFGAYAIAVDETAVYWTDQFHVHLTPKAGGSDLPLADASAEGVTFGVTVDATHVYYTLYGGME